MMPNQPPMAKTDVETGQAQPLLVPYPKMSESPKLRWWFLCRVYLILTIQLLLTFAVAAAIASYHDSIETFIMSTRGGYACFVLVTFTAIITMYPLYRYRQCHPVNYVLLVLFNLSMAFVVGYECAVLASHKVQVLILEAGILAIVMVLSLTLFTFWAAKRGYDFNFLGTFLFGSVMVVLVFGFIQIFFPLGKISVMIYGCFAAIIFCACIVCKYPDNRVMRYTYDEYIIWAVWFIMSTSTIVLWACLLSSGLLLKA